MDGMFKLIILDKADAMTPDAQASLRRVIEKYTKNVRFCLICNYIKKIDIAIQSRCTCFRFAPLKNKYMKQKLHQIISNEKIICDNDGIDTIIKRSKGDMRKVLNVLQSVSMAYDNVTEENVNLCLGYPSKADILIIMKSLVNDNFMNSHKLLMNYKENNGFSLTDIINEVHDFMITLLVEDKKSIIKLSHNEIMNIINYLSKIEYDVASSTDETTQFSAFVGIFKITV